MECLSSKHHKKRNLAVTLLQVLGTGQGCHYSKTRNERRRGLNRILLSRTLGWSAVVASRLASRGSRPTMPSFWSGYNRTCPDGGLANCDNGGACGLCFMKLTRAECDVIGSGLSYGGGPCAPCHMQTAVRHAED